MDQQKPSRSDSDQKESERERRKGNLILLGLFAAIVAIAVWLVNTMLNQQRIDDCAAQGRRNCAPLTGGADER